MKQKENDAFNDFPPTFNQQRTEGGSLMGCNADMPT